MVDEDVWTSRFLDEDLEEARVTRFLHRKKRLSSVLGYVRENLRQASREACFRCQKRLYKTCEECKIVWLLNNALELLE